MYNPYEVARYLVKLDEDNRLFNLNPIKRNGSTFYEGNARLNKYMHLIQNLYYAKTGELLIDATFYAYNNGAVIPSIQRDYKWILSTEGKIAEFNDDEELFIKKFFIAFINADIDEIIEIDHEDIAWIEKHNGTTSIEQQMNTEKYLEEYKEQYSDMLKVLDRMSV